MLKTRPIKVVNGPDWYVEVVKNKLLSIMLKNWTGSDWSSVLSVDVCEL